MVSSTADTGPYRLGKARVQASACRSSPLALATFFGALGGFGLVAKYGIGVGEAMSLAIAAPSALLISYLVTYAAWRVMRSSTGSSQIRSHDLAGAMGEVVTPIPASGLGEVTAMVDGQRFCRPGFLHRDHGASDNRRRATAAHPCQGPAASARRPQNPCASPRSPLPVWWRSAA
jgi:hypothetical protein